RTRILRSRYRPARWARGVRSSGRSGDRRPHRAALRSGTNVNRPSPRRDRGFALGAAVLLLVGWSLVRSIGGSGSVGHSARWPMVRAFAVAAAHPDLSASLARLAITSSGVTLAFATAGTALALVVGSVGGILSSNIWWGENRFVPSIWRGFLAIPRALHEVVW